jgi:hypothetical protein
VKPEEIKHVRVAEDQIGSKPVFIAQRLKQFDYWLQVNCCASVATICSPYSARCLWRRSRRNKDPAPAPGGACK